MDQRTQKLFALTLAALTLMLLLSFIAPPQPAQADLPPRPTEIPDTPEPEASVKPPPGSLIRLHGAFPSDWPWEEIAWQIAWTGVQWQDAHGAWHDVEGWQGGFDEVRVNTDGAVTAEKTWWLGEDHQGTGPFRWQVAEGRGGDVLAATEPFNLPEVDGQLKTIEVSLVAPTVD